MKLSLEWSAFQRSAHGDYPTDTLSIIHPSVHADGLTASRVKRGGGGGGACSIGALPLAATLPHSPLSTRASFILPFVSLATMRDQSGSCITCVERRAFSFGGGRAGGGMQLASVFTLLLEMQRKALAWTCLHFRTNERQNHETRKVYSLYFNYNGDLGTSHKIIVTLRLNAGCKGGRRGAFRARWSGSRNICTAARTVCTD